MMSGLRCPKCEVFTGRSNPADHDCEARRVCEAALEECAEGLDALEDRGAWAEILARLDELARAHRDRDKDGWIEAQVATETAWAEANRGDHDRAIAWAEARMGLPFFDGVGHERLEASTDLALFYLESGAPERSTAIIEAALADVTTPAEIPSAVIQVLRLYADAAGVPSERYGELVAEVDAQFRTSLTQDPAWRDRIAGELWAEYKRARASS